MDAGWRAFRAARELWAIEKDYDPSLAKAETLEVEMVKSELVLTA